MVQVNRGDSRDPSDRPTAETLLKHSAFCLKGSRYNFYDTDLAVKFRATNNTGSPNQGWEEAKLPLKAQELRNGCDAIAEVGGAY